MGFVAVVDYGAGNLASVERAVEYLGHKPVVTDDPARVLEAERVVFPGVGRAGAAMANLRRLGLDRALAQEVYGRGTPMLGICIGIQIIFATSAEDEADCLGILPGRVERFPASVGKVPQIGWNQVDFERPHPVFAGIASGSEFYFVNSYYPAPSEPELVAATTDYGGLRFASVVAKGNLVATQFHLEKSGPVGLAMLRNFLEWDGEAPRSV
jgi:glutamine amidotransferase